MSPTVLSFFLSFFSHDNYDYTILPVPKSCTGIKCHPYLCRSSSLLQMRLCFFFLRTGFGRGELFPCLFYNHISANSSNYDIVFDDNVIQPLNFTNIFYINITSNLSCWEHISEVAKSTFKKLGVLFRCRKCLSPEQLLQLYVWLILPCMEYCSYKWGDFPFTALLDKVESKAICLINDPNIT